MTVSDTRTWTLTIPAPAKMLSANAKPHHLSASRIRKAWREATYLYARQAKLPTGLDHVRIDITLHHTVNRGRDDANWHPYVAKPIVDALAGSRTVKARTGTRVEPGYGLIPDDTPDHLDGPYVSLGEKVSRADYPLGLAVVAVVDLAGEPAGGFAAERRVTSASVVWTFRCPVRHQVSVTLRRGEAEVQDAYRDLFMAQHAACEVLS